MHGRTRSSYRAIQRDVRYSLDRGASIRHTCVATRCERPGRDRDGGPGLVSRRGELRASSLRCFEGVRVRREATGQRALGSMSVGAIRATQSAEARVRLYRSMLLGQERRQGRGRRDRGHRLRNGQRRFHSEHAVSNRCRGDSDAGSRRDPERRQADPAWNRGFRRRHGAAQIPRSRRAAVGSSSRRRENRSSGSVSGCSCSPRGAKRAPERASVGSRENRFAFASVPTAPCGSLTWDGTE